MSDYLLDTNILIRYFRQEQGFRDLLGKLAADDWLCISAITRLEVVRGMRPHERQVTFELLNSVETIHVTSEVADRAGELMYGWQKRGVTLGEADALIAATALQYNLSLVTTNAKHFPMTDLVVYSADNKGRLTLRK
jgi:predicted nucleic acid-binding protein